MESFIRQVDEFSVGKLDAIVFKLSDEDGVEYRATLTSPDFCIVLNESELADAISALQRTAHFIEQRGDEYPCDPEEVECVSAV